VASHGNRDEREEEVGTLPLGLPKIFAPEFSRLGGPFIAKSKWARAYYQQQRARGQDHHAAVRTLAFKRIHIVFRCWQDRVVYDENQYLATLVTRGSPLSFACWAQGGLLKSLWVAGEGGKECLVKKLEKNP